ncbi:hypothetical protein STEG23_001203 [Scotinomys teguina]
MSHAEITLSGPDPLHSLNVRGYGYSHTRSPGAHGHLAGHGSPSAGQDVTSDSLICIITTICSVQVSKWFPAVTTCLSGYEEMTQRIRIASFNFLLYTSAKENFPKVTKGATVLAIELLAACQGIEFLCPLKTTTLVEKVYDLVRSVVRPWIKDHFMAPDIEAAHRSGKLRHRTLRNTEWNTSQNPGRFLQPPFH